MHPPFLWSSKELHPQPHPNQTPPPRRSPLWGPSASTRPPATTAREINSLHAAAIRLCRTFSLSQFEPTNPSSPHLPSRYYASLPSNQLELWFALEAERFQVPVFRWGPASRVFQNYYTRQLISTGAHTPHHPPHPHTPKRELYREKQVVAEERASRIDNSPTGRLFYEFSLKVGRPLLSSAGCCWPALVGGFY
jgi:hypothetical protein